MDKKKTPATESIYCKSFSWIIKQAVKVVYPTNQDKQMFNSSWDQNHNIRSDNGLSQAWLNVANYCRQ